LGVAIIFDPVLFMWYNVRLNNIKLWYGFCCSRSVTARRRV